MTEAHNTDPSYVLLSAAHNEEKNIAKTLESVVRQTAPPKRWVIASDNSSDRTEEIITGYAAKYPFIELVKVTRPVGRNFAAKVLALREGYKHLDGIDYGFIGNLDADITLDPSYFGDLRQRMLEAPALGIASGSIYEEENGRFQPREHNRTYSVPHAAQLVRRACYQDFGGWAILKFGGEDTHATTSARMKGWQVRSFPELKIYHQRHTDGASGQIRGAFRQGQMEYHLGYDFLFEMLKSAGRMKQPPFLVAGFMRMLGFMWSAVKREDRSVSKEFVAFIREEQRSRLSSLFVSGKMQPRL
jgi:glycosyltransferase involved in cell wall biosynthesis